MRREGGLSKLLIDAVLPIFVWAMMASLILHLIEVKAVFIQGGEARLRQAVLAFAFAIVLLQRLIAFENKEHAQPYGIAIGVAITFFAWYHATTFFTGGWYQLGVFFADELTFALLWWVGHRITAACAVDRKEDVAQAAETGIITNLKKKIEGEPKKALADAKSLEEREVNTQVKPEKTPEELEAEWSKRLPRRHPGLILLYFSLIALPLFGVGLWLFPNNNIIGRRMLGVLLFVYLFSAFALLCISSLNQFRAYLNERETSLPEMVGLTWLSVGLIVTSLVLTLAFFLPQPPSVSSDFVRNAMVSSYNGVASRYGFKDAAKPKIRTQQKGRFPTVKEVDEYLEHERYKNIDALGDEDISYIARHSGGEPYVQNSLRESARFIQTMKKIFEFIVRVIIYLLPVAAIFVLYILIASSWQSITSTLAQMRWMRQKKQVKRKPWIRKKRGKKDDLQPRQFTSFNNPFAVAYTEADGVALIRHCWKAMLALCADCGTPCPPEKTPFEFVDEKPQPLEGFEDSARFIARLFSFSEFSGQDVTQASLDELKNFWQNLQIHAAKVLP